MTIKNLGALEDLELFLEGNQRVAFTVPGDKTERYQFIRKILIKFRYLSLRKKDKGTVRRTSPDGL
ncbi:MAG: hypothetical protein GY820_36335 [Gammaproteobacteria bacterium]|nr:hypothetical protein [Gammaproteobacteria bacterium]